MELCVRDSHLDIALDPLIYAFSSFLGHTFTVGAPAEN